MVFLFLKNPNQRRYLIHKKTFNPHISVLIFHCKKHRQEIKQTETVHFVQDIFGKSADENKYATAKSDARMIEEKAVRQRIFQDRKLPNKI
jgi:hypothetical protein